jgi:hypothetical protein
MVMYCLGFCGLLAYAGPNGGLMHLWPPARRRGDTAQVQYLMTGHEGEGAGGGGEDVGGVVEAL